MILLLAALLTDGTIEDELRALQDDDIERRQAAVESLASLGEAGLEAIREARRSADGETRARLAEIEARIEADVRRRTFPGGAAVLDLKAALEVRRDPDRGRMVFVLQIMNVGPGERRCVEPDGWDLSLPGRHWESTGSRQRLEIRFARPEDEERAGAVYMLLGSGCRLGWEPPPVLRLRPGQIVSEPMELSPGFGKLRPGSYEARAVYYASQLLSGATADLETPWVAFTVPE